MQNQVLCQHIGLFAGRYLNQPREHARVAGDDAQLAVFSVFAFKYNDGINILIPQERERLPAPDDGRRNQRRNFRIEIAFEPLALLPADFAEIHQPDALLLQSLH